WAFASNALAALTSPLLFGALADRLAAPGRVLRWLAGAAVGLTLLASWAVERRASPAVVFTLILLHALAVVPSWSLLYSLALGRLKDARREFGPVRSMGTLGWVAGCLVISLIQADASTRAGLAGAGLWVVLVLLLGGQTAAGVVPERRVLTVRQRLGLDALALLRHADHRVVFLTACLISIPLAAFYPMTPLHLRDLGLQHTSAWMSLGQVTEVVAMFALARLLGWFRLKTIFACGLGFAFFRYFLCTLDGTGWVLTGVSLHGFAFTLFFITAPIYLNERVEEAWRARAQALMSLMTMGVGNLVGYLGTGWWRAQCSTGTEMNWSRFWGGLTVAVAAVGVYFLVAYRGRRTTETAAD
ncbi:MAG: MFS transporter, partial [Verrucomicrobiales bacterium]|nr:MFS transporter [Verrucomicrobiales bacterium]